MKSAQIFGHDRHHACTSLITLRPVAVLAGTSCILASLSYALPSSAASNAYTLNEYPAGVGASAGTGALPQEVTVGPDGNLWYTDEVSGVFKFSPKTLEALACSASSPAVGCEVSANAVAPTDIVAGPDGALWFTQSAGGNPRDGRTYFQAGIGRITTTGSYTSYPVPASASSVPGLDAITLGPNGNLWFTETAVNRIGEITPKAVDPTIHEFALPAADRLAAGVGSSITSADTIAAGPGNDIWFTEQGSNAIGVMSTSGTLLSKFTVPNSNLNPTPQGITEGPDQTMWFTENATNEVASITAQGKITVYALPGAASGPASIVYGPDGSLWFTDNTGVGNIDPSTGKVTLYRAHTASSGPVGITVGPDCTSIWFTESSADRLGRIAPVPNTTGCKPGAPIAVPEAPLSFSPSPLAFGGVVAGGPGVTKTLTVTNATGQSITLGRLSWGDYVGKVVITTRLPDVEVGTKQSASSGCGLGKVLSAGKSCVLLVTLKVSRTSAAGLAGATLKIVVTDLAGATLGVATLLVTNTGTGPLSFSPSPLAFGGVVAGGPGVTKTLTVTNATGRSITLGRLSWGDYVGKVVITTRLPDVEVGTKQSAGSGCRPGKVLSAGKSCVLLVTLKVSRTSAAGLAGATLNIVVTDLAGATLGVATLLVTNTGTGPLSFSPAPLALGHVVVGSSGGVIKTLKVTNLTSQNITLGALGYDRAAVDTGTGTIRFTVDTSKSTCGVGVVLGRVGESEEVTKSCDFVVTFTVSKIGAFGATLSLASTGQNRTALPAATLPFSGTGVAPLAWSPSPLALGDVVVGSSGGVTRTLKVTNLTSQNITLGALGYDRAAVDTGTGTIRFTVDTSKSTCGVGVALGRVGESEEVTRSCDFVVTFTVSKIGAFGATLSLASTGQNRTALPAATLPLSGTGVASP